MRPLELELRNFRSYQGSGAKFDFRGRRLIGIVGPIGSGKSSLLDAVAFALYGKTPTSGTSRKSLIHQRANDMAVKLRFSVGDEIWEVVRVLRRKGQAQHALYRLASDGVTTGLEPDSDDASTEIRERVVQDGPVSERIEELLGLDYDAFGRSVMLAQNRFSQFLSATAGERDTVLKGVFGHDRIDRMRSRAKELLGECELTLEKLTVRTERLDTVAARLGSNTAAKEKAATRLDVLEKTLPQHVALRERLVAAGEAVKATERSRDSLREAGAQIPAPEQTDALLEAARSAATRRTELASVMDAKAADLTAADGALAALVESGEDALIDKAGTLIAQRTMQQTEIDKTQGSVADLVGRVATVGAEVADLETSVLRAGERGKTTDKAVAVADAALEEARLLLAQAERDDMAATLRAGLAVGRACPVCEHPVAAVPTSAPLEMTDELRSRVAHAAEHRSAAEAERTEAIADLSRVSETLESRRSSHAEISQRQTDAVTQLEARLRDLDNVILELDGLLGTGDHAVLLDERKQRRAGLVKAVQEAKQDLERARSAHEQAVRDAQSVIREMSSLVSLVAAAGAKLDLQLAPDRDVPDDVADALGQLREQVIAGLDELDAAVATATAEETAAATAIEALVDQLGLSRPLPEEIASLQATVAHLETEITRDQAELDAAETLLADKEAAERKIEIYTQLVRDLRDSEFVRFLLDEERARLAALGSDHFLRLSSGRYAFTEDGDFSIVDLTSADAVRKAASLSGGETFLASLALALALAEMVARTGGRLDAFFLDEGFGSLDAEHLDLAMEGIEALVAEDQERLVVLVSHVPELRHRIDDRIELERDPLTGNTRIVQG